MQLILRPKSEISFCALALICALPILSISVDAKAEGKDVVVVIEAPDADLTTESLVRISTEDALKTVGRVVAPLSTVGGEAGKSLALCASDDALCISRAISGARVSSVLFVQLESATGRTGDWVMTQALYDTQNGQRLRLNRRVCKGCSDPDLFAQSVEDQTTQLIRDSESAQADNQDALAKDSSSDDSRYGGWKYATFGLGAAAIAGGVTLIVLDGPQINDNQRERDERATRTEGIVLTSVGAALALTSIYMFATDSKQPSGAPRVSAQWKPGGGVLTFGGRF